MFCMEALGYYSTLSFGGCSCCIALGCPGGVWQAQAGVQACVRSRAPAAGVVTVCDL